MLYSNQFYFITPRGLFININDIPDECGLVEINEYTGMIEIVKEAPFRQEVKDPDLNIVASICRNTTSESAQGWKNRTEKAVARQVELEDRSLRIIQSVTDLVEYLNSIGETGLADQVKNRTNIHGEHNQ